MPNIEEMSHVIWYICTNTKNADTYFPWLQKSFMGLPTYVWCASARKLAIDDLVKYSYHSTLWAQAHGNAMVGHLLQQILVSVPIPQPVHWTDLLNTMKNNQFRDKQWLQTLKWPHWPNFNVKQSRYLNPLIMTDNITLNSLQA